MEKTNNKILINISDVINIWGMYDISVINKYLSINLHSVSIPDKITAQIAYWDIILDNPQKALLLINKKRELFIKNEEYLCFIAYLKARIGKNKDALSIMIKLNNEKYKYFLNCLKIIKSPFTFTNKMASITKSDGVHPHFGYLETLIRKYKLKKGAEVGVFMGFHSEHILQACRNVELYLVDPYSVMKGSGYDDWNNLVFQILYLRLRYKFSKYKRAHFVRKISEEAVKEFKNSELDFVYLDADHRYEGIKKDLKMWALIVRKGGIIAGHDYKSKQWPGVTKAVTEWAQENNFKIKSGLGMFWYTIKI